MHIFLIVCVVSRKSTYITELWAEPDARLTPFLVGGTNDGQTTVIQTWIPGRSFLENKGSESVTGDTDDNDEFQWTNSDF